MRVVHRSATILDDCLLATFTLTIAAAVVLTFASTFAWPAKLALLMIPTALLSTHRRSRAAGFCAGVALMVGAWEIVPPAGSFALDSDGVAAVITFAAAAMATIALANRVARRNSASRPSESNA